ncbi:MAG: NAD(P)H-binding protein, partial [Microlunatus sp.]|nr:NAD(P)H-binding protein [Microlunatus sp.]
MSSESVELANADRLRVAFAGGHGQIALLAQRRLAVEGHQPLGMIRNAEQADDLRAVGAEPIVFDLENQTAAELAELIAGVDALVFAAGAGPDSGPARKMTVDRDGAVLLADAAELAGIRRYVVI